MLDVIVRAGTSLYNAMLSVFNSLFYSPVGQWGFFDVLGNSQFYITLIGFLFAGGLIKRTVGSFL